MRLGLSLGLATVILLPSQESPGAVRHETAKQDRAADFGAKLDAIVDSCMPGILKHRTRIVRLRGKPGARVRVRQQRHAFRFGTAISNAAFDGRMAQDDREQYLAVLEQNFNAAVHENALKWYSTERRPGKIDFRVADDALAWCESHGLAMRGHCVYWGRDKLVPAWQKALGDDALRLSLADRARDVMTRYRGRIPEYDVNNEMVHCTYYRDRLGEAIWPQMFRWCRQHDPDAVLYVNDYGILTGGDLSRYEKQIRGFLDAGLPVGGVGVQGHYTRMVDAEVLSQRLDRLAQFGLPIAITEFDVNVADEHVRALALATLYSRAFAHPSVVSITMWGFWEGAHWRPKAALWRRDWSETLVSRSYRDLVFGRWWTDFDGEFDSEGICDIRVFYGTHAVTIDGETETLNVLPAAREP